MHIAFATHEDTRQLSTLLSTLFAQEADFVPNEDKQTAGLSQIIANADVGQILVCRHEAGSAILGMVSLLYTVSTARGGRVAFLEDMIVAPQHRGQGVGTRLLAAAIDHARDAGCLRITLLTDHDNQEAMHFYRRHGFSASAMTPMRLMLETDTTD